MLRQAKYPACVEQNKNSYKIFVGERERDHLLNLAVDISILLKQILKK
jgi:hypothetical protein